MEIRLLGFFSVLMICDTSILIFFVMYIYSFVVQINKIQLKVTIIFKMATDLGHRDL